MLGNEDVLKIYVFMYIEYLLLEILRCYECN